MRGRDRRSLAPRPRSPRFVSTAPKAASAGRTRCRRVAEADERSTLLAQIARRFRKARVLDDPKAGHLLDMVACAEPGDMLRDVLDLVEPLVGW